MAEVAGGNPPRGHEQDGQPDQGQLPNLEVQGPDKQQGPQASPRAIGD